jgi:hypothetical protein
VLRHAVLLGGSYTATLVHTRGHVKWWDATGRPKPDSERPIRFASPKEAHPAYTASMILAIGGLLITILVVVAIVALLVYIFRR